MRTAVRVTSSDDLVGGIELDLMAAMGRMLARQIYDGQLTTKLPPSRHSGCRFIILVTRAEAATSLRARPHRKRKQRLKNNKSKIDNQGWRPETRTHLNPT